jgi:RNA polymerase-binding transcription factor DksA
MATLKRMRRRHVENELKRVTREVEAIRKEPRAAELEGFGDNTPLSEELDAGVAAEEKELGSDRLQRLLDRAAALDEALHRFDEGTYGACVVCGGEIPARRLNVVPEAVRCTRCQEDVEKTPARHELHSHEWRRAEETFREREKSEKPEATALFGSD